MIDGFAAEGYRFGGELATTACYGNVSAYRILVLH